MHRHTSTDLSTCTHIKGLLRQVPAAARWSSPWTNSQQREWEAQRLGGNPRPDGVVGMQRQWHQTQWSPCSGSAAKSTSANGALLVVVGFPPRLAGAAQNQLPAEGASQRGMLSLAKVRPQNAIVIKLGSAAESGTTVAPAGYWPVSMAVRGKGGGEGTLGWSEGRIPVKTEVGGSKFVGGECT